MAEHFKLMQKLKSREKEIILNFTYIKKNPRQSGFLRSKKTYPSTIRMCISIIQWHRSHPKKQQKKNFHIVIEDIFYYTISRFCLEILQGI